MEAEIKIQSEQKDCYIADINGKTVKLFKIDMEELKLKHENDLYLASRHLSNADIHELLVLTTKILQFTPDVDHYKGVADKVTDLMENLFSKLAVHDLSHLFHHLIKDINPEIYGKAQTFMRQINLLHDTMSKIHQFINE